MASVDSLIPLIYHEKQQQGSMLCAQHALNSLLQGNYFSAPDLSAIAQNLDDLETSYDDDNTGHTSTNMDDTGFFSIQVLENALSIWGLSLVRWRSELMRPYQDHPHTQLGFILNLQQHWYTLRRFGTASPDPSLAAEPGEGHWFNLNSFLQAPEWVSKLYLGMVLQQAEAEGYSVFAVVQLHPDQPLALPRTEADELAASIPESTAANVRPSGSQSSAPQNALQLEGFEDEDMELQAALQASLMHSGYETPPAQPTSSTSSYSGALMHQQPVMRGFGIPGHLEVGDEDEDEEMTIDSEVPAPEPMDPVAASMARNRVLLERMRRQQEAALQETREDEIAQYEARRARRSAEEEAEMVRRAIAASRGENDEEDDEDEDAVVVPPTRAVPSHEAYRVYDDDDAELQAALKASLETVPEGFRIPDSPPPSISRTEAPQQARTESVPPVTTMNEEDDSESEADSSVAEPEAAAVIDVEEMRRRRLAKFGG